MKYLTALTLLLIGWIASAAQQCEMAHIDNISNDFKVSKSILVMFEKLDTFDADDNKFRISRSYYFDEKQRKLNTVREYENCLKPKKGLRITYTFIDSRLAKVMVIPPRSKCKNCTSEYYYSADTLLAKKETCYMSSDPEAFISQSHFFQSKLPPCLAWGYFQNEVILNGKMKKAKNHY